MRGNVFLKKAKKVVKFADDIMFSAALVGVMYIAFLSYMLSDKKAGDY